MCSRYFCEICVSLFGFVCVICITFQRINKQVLCCRLKGIGLSASSLFHVSRQPPLGALQEAFKSHLQRKSDDSFSTPKTSGFSAPRGNSLPCPKAELHSL
ncbi:hypothetical protein GOODEAATRI_009414 [Goodea atripinnis]|uniref:Uncharacterized protein n=1 Tax=Goodea atripinnis TaxID=208336 RepID=A0ABV0MGC9_9TELE